MTCPYTRELWDDDLVQDDGVRALYVQSPPIFFFFFFFFLGGGGAVTVMFIDKKVTRILT